MPPLLANLLSTPRECVDGWVHKHSLSAWLTGLREVEMDVNMGKSLASRNMKVGRALMEMIPRSLVNRQGHPDFCRGREKPEIPWEGLGKLL